MKIPCRKSSLSLSFRERQIVTLIGRGLTNKEIVPILDVSIHTVANHRKSICRKLDLRSTAEVVAYACRYVMNTELAPSIGDGQSNSFTHTHLFT